jgi:hypothetical protein
MINPQTVIITVVLVVLTLAVSRKHFLLPFITAVCFIPFDQRIIILGLDFTPMRLLVVFGVLRILVRGEQREIRWNVFDRIIVAWAFCGAVVYVIQTPNISELIYISGVIFDIVGLYWLFRQNIDSWESVNSAATFMAMAAFITALLVLAERVTERNPFVLLGRAQTGFHRGRYRCSGSFQHSIMLGLFWANLVPIFVGYAMANRCRMWYWWIATAACVLIVIATGSSTPLATLLWILLLLPLFRYRRYGRIAALGFFGTILALHIVMAKPVWHLIGRAKLISGSTGYHRYRLINAAIEHFDEWALLGTRNTAHWGYHLYDVTNHYIRQGINGGFITLLLLIIVLGMGITTCGRYSLLSTRRREQWLSWAFCVSVLGHCMSFLGVSYFGKIPMLLYFTLATVAMICDRQKTLKTTIATPLYPNQT